MELTKVLDGFTVADTLVIKAQVQVIRFVSFYDLNIGIVTVYMFHIRLSCSKQCF